ncbi:MAG: IS5 family transposase [Gammaproteobacteria bacterium]|nr:IS5 family transposase [Gammaproteobacteria bacterium]
MRRHELTDEQWKRVRSLLPKRRGAPSKKGERNFINGVLWIAKTGAPWRDLPGRFGKWKTIFNRFNNWAKAEKWQRLFEQLGLSEDEILMLDSSSIRAHQDSCGGEGGAKKAPLEAPEAVVRPKFISSQTARKSRSEYS